MYLEALFMVNLFLSVQEFQVLPPDPHIKSLMRWCTGSFFEVRRKSVCFVCG